MKTSIFDLFKIGIGPSSSHTVGPMRAARRFVNGLGETGVLGRTERVVTELYGSLALTGIGHGTDRAVLLGLSDEKPEEVDPASVESTVEKIRASRLLMLLKLRPIAFEESLDLLFLKDLILPGHSNAMRFSAFDAEGESLSSEVFFSIGGGFILKQGEEATDSAPGLTVPHPFSNAAELLEQAALKKLPIWKLMLENESALRSERQVRERISLIWSVMNECIERGLRTEGILPGGLHVRRRAPRM